MIQSATSSKISSINRRAFDSRDITAYVHRFGMTSVLEKDSSSVFEINFFVNEKAKLDELRFTVNLEKVNGNNFIFH